MSATSGRAVRVFATSLIGAGSAAFGVVGWFTYGSVMVALLAAGTVLAEGAAVVLLGERMMSRRRRRRPPRPPDPPPSRNPEDPDWIPAGWELPPYERYPPTDPPA